MTQPPAYLSSRELADRWNVSRDWIYLAVRRDQIPYIRIGGMLRFDPDEMDRWIAENSTEAVA